MIDELLLRTLAATFAATLPADEPPEIAESVEGCGFAVSFLAVGLLGALAHICVGAATDHLIGVALPGGPIFSFGAFSALGNVLNGANYYRMRRAMRRRPVRETSGVPHIRPARRGARTGFGRSRLDLATASPAVSGGLGANGAEVPFSLARSW